MYYIPPDVGSFFYIFIDFDYLYPQSEKANFF